MASLIGVVGTVAVILGVLGLLVSSFIGSSGSVSSTTRSALARDDVRRAVAEELVDKLEEGSDDGVKIIIHVARSKVVDAVTLSLSDSKLRMVAGETAATVYGAFIEGKPRTTVSIQMFVDEAFTAIRSADPLIPQSLSPQVDPIEISHDDGSPDFANIRSRAFITTWALLVGGLVLLAISWLMSVAGKWLRVRRIGIRFFVGGAALILLGYLARSITFDDESSGHLAEALVSFSTSRLIMWSIIITAIGVIVTILGAIMNRRVTSTRTASA